MSNPTRAGLDYPSQELESVLGRAARGAYSPSPFGLTRAREAISEDWQQRGLQVDPADLVMTASTSEAYSLLFKLLCDPGDEVLVPEPSYPLFEVLASLEGVSTRGYRLGYDGAWYVDLDSVRAGQTPRTRALIVVSPNNPTGSYAQQAEFAALSGLGMPLISDEVFFAYSLRELAQPRATAASLSTGLVFVLDGLSKRCGLPQLKLSWITLAGDGALKQAARQRLEVINDSYLSASGPVQRALPELLELGAGLQRQILARCQHNLSWLNQCCPTTSVTPLHVEGGWSVCLRLPSVLTEDAWVLSLLEEQGVLVQPGWFYDFGQSPVVVISLLVEPSVFHAALSKLLDHVADKLCLT